DRGPRKGAGERRYDAVHQAGRQQPGVHARFHQRPGGGRPRHLEGGGHGPTALWAHAACGSDPARDRARRERLPGELRARRRRHDAAHQFLRGDGRSLPPRRRAAAEGPDPQAAGSREDAAPDRGKGAGRALPRRDRRGDRGRAARDGQRRQARPHDDAGPRRLPYRDPRADRGRVPRLSHRRDVAALISLNSIIPGAAPFGDPWVFDSAQRPGRTLLAAAEPVSYPGGHTTQFSVVDQWGNIVSYTTTIEQGWGTGIMVPVYGFMLNNELTDFNFGFNLHPRFGGQGANDVEGGKRPRSSMTPTILFRGREPVA